MKCCVLIIALAVGTHFLIVSAFVRPAMEKGQGGQANGGPIARPAVARIP